VPIVPATYPVLVGTPGADRVFHVVFFIVVAVSKERSSRFDRFTL